MNTLLIAVPLTLLPSMVTPGKDADKHVYGEKTSGAGVKPAVNSIRRHMDCAVAKETR